MECIGLACRNTATKGKRCIRCHLEKENKELKKAVVDCFLMNRPGLKQPKGDDKCNFCPPSSFDPLSEVWDCEVKEWEDQFCICDTCVLKAVISG